MRMRAGLIFVGVLILAGCGGESAPSVAPVAASSAATSTTTTTTTTPTTGTVPLGSEVKMVVSGYTVRVTVFSLGGTVTSKQGPPPAGSRYVSVNAKFCLDSSPSSTPVTLSWAPWSVIDAQSGTYQATQIVYGDFPMPQFPAYDKTPIAPGECSRGNIVFPVASDATIVSVKYATKTGETARWSVT